MRQLPDVWDDRHWNEPLASFARATGLSVSVYGSDGARKLGPYIHHPVAQMLSASGSFMEGGVASGFERALVAGCAAGVTETRGCFEQALEVRCRAARVGEVPAGYFVYGWVFSRFPDPLQSEHVARRTGIPSNRFWLASRQHLPVGSERFAVFESLLDTLTGALLNQLATQRALLDADRMKDEFLSNLSHELRTPLTSVQLRVQSLARTLVPGDARVSGNFEAIQRGLKAQARLIDELLDTSRILTGKMSLERRWVNFSRVVTTAIETVQPMAQAKGVELVVRVPPATRDIHADPDRLQQMIWNLVVNGVKFTPEGGTVTVEMVERLETFELMVSDTGEGISPEFLPRIFDRFSQARENAPSSQKGLGLGLSLVRYIAELHGGAASVESDGRGRGAAFRIVLPTRSP